MKKFLHLEFEKSAPEIPLALDQRILAAAAMRPKRSDGPMDESQ